MKYPTHTVTLNGIVGKVAVNKDQWTKQGEYYLRNGEIFLWNESCQMLLTSLDEGGKIIAATLNLQLTGVPELVIEGRGDDLYKQANSWKERQLRKGNKTADSYSYEEGLRAAQSKAMFNEADLRKAWKAGVSYGMDNSESEGRLGENFVYNDRGIKQNLYDFKQDEIISSLTPTPKYSG